MDFFGVFEGRYAVQLGILLFRIRQGVLSSPEEAFKQVAQGVGQAPCRGRARGGNAGLFLDLVLLLPVPGIAVQGDVQASASIGGLEGQARIRLPVLHPEDVAAPGTNAPTVLDDVFYTVEEELAFLGVVEVPAPRFLGGGVGFFAFLWFGFQEAQGLSEGISEQGVRGSEAFLGSLSEVFEHVAGMFQEPLGQLAGVPEGLFLDLASNVVAQDVRFCSGISHFPAQEADLFHDPVEEFALEAGMVGEISEFFCALLRGRFLLVCGGILILWTG